MPQKPYVATPHPKNDKRVSTLHSYDILDTAREAEFDDVVHLIARICDVPFAVINFIDTDRQWFSALPVSSRCHRRFDRFNKLGRDYEPDT